MIGQALQHVPDIDDQRAFGRTDGEPASFAIAQFEPGFLRPQKQCDEIDVLVRPARTPAPSLSTGG
jgi:hypothetical protein